MDPFADAWPVIEGWLIAQPSIAAHALMARLAEKFPQAYAGKAQLRTLQRRVKEWRAERAKEMILGGYSNPQPLRPTDDQCCNIGGRAGLASNRATRSLRQARRNQMPFDPE